MTDFNISIRHLRHKSLIWLSSRIDNNPPDSKINISLRQNASPEFTNGESCPSYLIKFDKNKLTEETYPPEKIPADILCVCHLAMDMGHSEFCVTGHGKLLPYLPHYDYNVPTKTTPAHTIEYCMQGSKYLYIRNIADEI